MRGNIQVRSSKLFKRQTRNSHGHQEGGEVSYYCDLNPRIQSHICRYIHLGEKLKITKEEGYNLRIKQQ